MLNKKDVANLLAKLNNRFYETGEHQYAEAYKMVAYQIDKESRKGMPMHTLPFVLTSDDVMTMMSAVNAVEYQNTISHRAKIKKAEETAEKKALESVKKINWWRRLWKLF